MSLAVEDLRRPQLRGPARRKQGDGHGEDHRDRRNRDQDEDRDAVDHGDADTARRSRPGEARDDEPGRNLTASVLFASPSPRTRSAAGVRYAPSASGYASAWVANTPCPTTRIVRFRWVPSTTTSSPMCTCAAWSVSAPSATSSTAIGARPAAIAGRISPRRGSTTNPSAGRPSTRSAAPASITATAETPGSCVTRPAYWFGMPTASKFHP